MEDLLSIGLGAGSGLFVALGIWVYRRQSGQSGTRLPNTPQLDAAVLVRQDQVIDITPDARAFFGDALYTGQSWDTLSAVLRQRFQDVPDSAPRAVLRVISLERPDDVALTITPIEHGQRLRVEAAADVLSDLGPASGAPRMPSQGAPIPPRPSVTQSALDRASPNPVGTLSHQMTMPAAATGHTNTQLAPSSHVDSTPEADEAHDPSSRLCLEQTLAAIPHPVWLTEGKSRLAWCNRAYQDLADKVDPGKAEDGASRSGLFDDQILPARVDLTQRVHLDLFDGTRRWFEVLARPVDGAVVYVATAIDSLVEAELAQRNFVQTLTKTFAHLPIGLAVFDRDRRMALFNPALVSLTRLPVDFLTSRPTVLGFFDQLRENRMMPEPKSYSAWREQLSGVIDAARDDRYSETWNLPSGLTYRITGRPHPDRAVAFLIEDISSEVTLTRRFRSEIALTQSVLDRFEDAVVVFSQLGVLTLCNSAFRELWDCDPDSQVTEVGILDMTQLWQSACAPTPIWGDLRDFVLTLRDRSSWEVPLALLDGRPLLCSVEPVAGGSSMIRFSSVATAPKLIDETP